MIYDRYITLESYLSRIEIQYMSSIHFLNSTVPGPLPKANIKYTPKWFRTPCGLLARCALLWGPSIPTSQAKGICKYAFNYSSAATKRNTFHQGESAWQYSTGAIDPSKCQVQSKMFDNSLWFIGQALVALRSKDPHLTIQVELDIRLQFQFCCYNNKYPPQSRVIPTPIQGLSHITSIVSSSSDLVLQYICYMTGTWYLTPNCIVYRFSAYPQWLCLTVQDKGHRPKQTSSTLTNGWGRLMVDWSGACCFEFQVPPLHKPSRAEHMPMIPDLLLHE